MASYDVASNICQALNSGEPGIVRLILRDRFGNAVPASRALFTFEGRASGPGGVAVELQEAPDGAVQFAFSTTVAGIYKISVTCVDTNEVLPGLPIDAIMGSQKLSHVGCTASLQTLTSATKAGWCKL